VRADARAVGHGGQQESLALRDACECGVWRHAPHSLLLYCIRAATELSSESFLSVQPWLQVTVGAEGVTLTDGREHVSYEGSKATRLVPRTLAWCDGRRTIRQICEAAGEDRPDVAELLEFLIARRWITESSSTGRRPAQRLTLAQAFEWQEPRLAPEGLDGRVARTSVRVVGDSDAATGFADLAARSGFGAVERGSLPSTRLPADDAVVVACPDPDEAGLLTEVNRMALAHCTPWLPLRPFDGEILAIGPMFVPGKTACNSCYVLRRSARRPNRGAAQARPSRSRTAADPPAFALLSASLAVHLLIGWLAEPARVVGRMLSLVPEPLPTVTPATVVRVADCPDCAGGWPARAPTRWSDLVEADPAW
jgi:bacteriocin biosynthesis cyclodehydratase domain-containing protein